MQLPTIHGLIRRRILVNFRVDPEVMQRLLPEPFRPKLLGDAALASLGFLNMGGEDFAYYLEKVPGCFIRVGARENGGEPIPAHSPRFYAADDAIFVGAAVLAETARVAAERLTGRGATAGR